MTFHPWPALPSTLALLAFASGPACSDRDGGAPGVQSGALTVAQCEFFYDPGAKTTICHRTGSAKNRFQIIKTDYNGCVHGHATHAEDYIASNDPAAPNYDPNCDGQGCYPEHAPWDGSAECCEGLEVRDGVCTKTGPECVPEGERLRDPLDCCEGLVAVEGECIVGPPPCAQEGQPEGPGGCCDGLRSEGGVCERPTLECDFSSALATVQQYTSTTRGALEPVFTAFEGRDCKSLFELNPNDLAKQLQEARQLLSEAGYRLDVLHSDCSARAEAQGLEYDGTRWWQIKEDIQRLMDIHRELEAWFAVECEPNWYQ
ncbi:MAG: hypothetical protein IT385_24075 [Deltaproteobacteria bacterium]|nr:hypothetical protein [Deltaproteobacteria bacterium]